MSVYLKLFILRSGVESHRSLILKKKGEEQQQWIFSSASIPSEDLHKCVLFEVYFYISLYIFKLFSLLACQNTSGMDKKTFKKEALTILSHTLKHLICRTEILPICLVILLSARKCRAMEIYLWELEYMWNTDISRTSFGIEKSNFYFLRHSKSGEKIFQYGFSRNEGLLLPLLMLCGRTCLKEYLEDGNQ